MQEIVDDSSMNMELFWTSLLASDNTETMETPKSVSSLSSEFISLTPIHNTIFSSSFKNALIRSMTCHIDSTNKDDLQSEKKNDMFAESPIATVLNYPTGLTNSKLRKNQQIINIQKKRIEQIETELEIYADKYESLKTLVENLEASNKR